MTWHRIASLHEVEPGQRKVVQIEGKELALLHTDRGLWCIDFRCPHTGGPLGEGIIAEDEIICPLHKWKFQLCDGTHNRGTACEPAGVYQLRAEGDDVLVELENVKASSDNASHPAPRQ